MEEPAEEEWEYVYDTNETETIILTVDLAAPLGPNSFIAETNGGKEQTDEAAPAKPTRNDAPRSIQFLDLPSKAPYISYQGQIFTGTWGETVGSDLVFASTSDMPEDFEPVLQSQDGKWCLLGVSRTTLAGRPVEVIKRPRVSNQVETPLIGNDGTLAANPGQNGLVANAQPKKPFTIVVPPDVDPKLQKQAEYLEQLMAIKLAKGEKDIVYLGKSAKYIDADGVKMPGRLYTKRDWDKMNENDTGQRARQTKKTRTEDDADDESSDLGNAEDDPDEENGEEQDIEGSQEEDEEQEPEEDRIDDSQIQANGSNGDGVER